jgi:hypothetical protein
MTTIITFIFGCDLLSILSEIPKTLVIIITALYVISISVFLFCNRKKSLKTFKTKKQESESVIISDDISNVTKPKPENVYKLFENKLSMSTETKIEPQKVTVPVIMTEAKNDNDKFDEEYNEPFPIEEEDDKTFELSELKNKDIFIDGVSIEEILRQEQEERLKKYYDPNYKISREKQDVLNDGEFKDDWENAERHYDSLPEANNDETDETFLSGGISRDDIISLSEALAEDYVMPKDESERKTTINNLRRTFVNLSDTELFNQITQNEILAKANEQVRSIIDTLL